MAKIVATLSIYVGFINEVGKLLLVKRTSDESVVPGVSFRGNWELPGGSVEDADSLSYDYHIRTGIAKAEEKVGIHLDFTQAPRMYTFLFKGAAGCDLCAVIPVVSHKLPNKGETLYVSPLELKGLAVQFVSATDAEKQGLSEGQGLISGWGKRMCCMSLNVLTHSPDTLFASEAHQLLSEIAVR